MQHGFLRPGLAGAVIRPTLMLVPRFRWSAAMRPLVLVLCCFPLLALAQDTARHGVALDPATYPQGTPQQTLASLLKAIEAKRLDYVVAQLAEPGWVDERIKRLYAGKFEEQVADTRARLDPVAVKLLQRLQKEGEWKIADKEAHLSAKDVADRSVYLKKLGDRWVLEHKQSP
jgi:hypothetical protein